MIICGSFVLSLGLIRYVSVPLDKLVISLPHTQLTRQADKHLINVNYRATLPRLLYKQQIYFFDIWRCKIVIKCES